MRLSETLGVIGKGECPRKMEHNCGKLELRGTLEG